MNKVVFLTMDSLEDFCAYDDLLIKPFNERNWDVKYISWREKNVNWNEFDAVIVRSTWDYQSDPENFFSALNEINNSSAHLENKLELMKWNADKKYLADLETKGISIVKTLWQKKFDLSAIKESFIKLQTDEIILKPNISASAENTFRISRNNLEEFRDEIKSVFDQRRFMIQPFIKHILDEGEYSLFFFGGEYSHSILKTPKKDDFRSQEEHGGTLKKIKPEKELINLSQEIMKQLISIPLYMRVDFVRNDTNKFELMELELIEPSLYFNLDENSPEGFVEVFLSRWNNISESD